MDETQELPVPQIPLTRAVLCLDEECETVHEQQGSGECPRCGSRHGLALSRVVKPLWGEV